MGEEKNPEAPPSQEREGFAAAIDLPEGHHLVIGELPPGTIVEVATWQGTGRPNESTNRFLLSASGSGLQKRSIASEKVKLPEIESAPPSSQPSHTDIAPVTGATLSIGSIGAAGSRVSSRNISNESDVHTYAQKNSIYRRIGQTIFVAVSIGAITSMVLGLLGVAAVVPTRGAETAFGSSSQSLVLYRKTPSVEIGAPTVARYEKGSEYIYIFGPSNSFDEKFLQIETSAGQELVEPKSVMGRGFLAIPLVGIIFRPVFG